MHKDYSNMLYVFKEIIPFLKHFYEGVLRPMTPTKACQKIQQMRFNKLVIKFNLWEQL